MVNVMVICSVDVNVNDSDMFSDLFRSSRGELFMFLAESHTPCLVGLLSGEAANLSEFFFYEFLGDRFFFIRSFILTVDCTAM